MLSCPFLFVLSIVPLLDFHFLCCDFSSYFSSIPVKAQFRKFADGLSTISSKLRSLSLHHPSISRFLCVFLLTCGNPGWTSTKCGPYPGRSPFSQVWHQTNQISNLSLMMIIFVTEESSIDVMSKHVDFMSLASLLCNEYTQVSILLMATGIIGTILNKLRYVCISLFVKALLSFHFTQCLSIIWNNCSLTHPWCIFSTWASKTTHSSSFSLTLWMTLQIPEVVLSFLSGPVLQASPWFFPFLFHH